MITFSQMHGMGRFESFGSTYDGEFENNLKSGHGSLTYTGGQNYTGNWKMGLPGQFEDYFFYVEIFHF